MKCNVLFGALAGVALCVCACSTAPARLGLTDTDSLACVVNRRGTEVTVTADYPTADTTLQMALAGYMHSMMPAGVTDSVTHDGRALLAACAEAALTYMTNPAAAFEAGDEAGIDVILGERAPSEDSEIPSAEELEAFDGAFARSSYSAAFPKVYESADYISWQCSWSLYAEGTPHPACGITGATFRKSDGQRIGHKMLKNTDSEGFHKLLKETLRQWLEREWEWKAATDEQMAEALSEGIELDALPLPASAPFLLPGGVALAYQEWELTGGRDVQVLILPYDKIKNYLNNVK